MLPYDSNGDVIHDVGTGLTIIENKPKPTFASGDVAPIFNHSPYAMTVTTTDGTSITVPGKSKAVPVIHQTADDKRAGRPGLKWRFEKLPENKTQ